MVDAEDALDVVEVAEEVSVRARISRVSLSLPVEPSGEYGGGALILVCIGELDYLKIIAALYWKQVYIFSPSRLMLLFPYRYRSRSTYSSLSQC